MKKVYNVGILSDSPLLTTGFANQSTAIANILSEAGHDVTYFAHAYGGQMLVPPIRFQDGKELKFKVVGGGREAYFKDLLQIYVKQHKIDILLIYLDTFMLYDWFLRMDLSPAKVIFYYLSDGGGGLPLNCENILKKVDYPLAAAKFAQKQVKDLYNLDSDYIPNTINAKDFYPISKEEKEKLKAKRGLSGKFVVGTVARNQGRKMMDRTFKAFRLYADRDPNAVLFLHTDPNDVAQVFNMHNLIKRYNLQNRVLFSGMSWYKGFNYKDMKDVYNVMDVFLLTTSGEGFGIPLVEAMACEIPVVATDYTTTRELVLDHDAGLGIDLVGTITEENPRVHNHEILEGTITGSWDVERGICSLKDCCNKLSYLRNNPERAAEMGKNGRAAVLKYYDWEVTKPEWLALIDKIGGEY